MKPSELTKLKKLYNHWLMGDPTPAEQVGWSGTVDQEERFAQFVELIKHDRVQDTRMRLIVLDVGCGDGALLGYLRRHLPGYHISYVGIDINNNYVERAMQTYRGDRAVRFIVGDFESHEFHETFDYVFCSGAYNVNVFENIERAYDVFFCAITKMVSLATIGVGVNFLFTKQAGDLMLTGDMIIYDKKKIIDWCAGQKLKYSVIEGYDPFDTTVLILK